MSFHPNFASFEVTMIRETENYSFLLVVPLQEAGGARSPPFARLLFRLFGRGTVTFIKFCAYLAVYQQNICMNTLFMF